MQFDLDEDRALLKQSTRELLEKESPVAEGRKWMEEAPEGFSRALYRQLGELGYLALTLPEDAGGADAGALGLVAVLHEMGRVAFPGPYLDLVLAGEALRRTAHPAAARELAALSTGERHVVLARSESLTGHEPPVPVTGFAGGRVRGVKRFVPFGATADALLVTTAEGLALVARPASGWDATPLTTLDHAQRFVEIELDAPGELVADTAAAAPILDAVDRLAALGAAALALGIAERCLEMSVAFLKERRAFGVPIGSFQALQHRAADMLLRVESTRSVVYRAGWTLDEEPAQADYLSAVAKVYADETARRVCGDTLQIHGGVGFTWEYDPHIYLKRAKTLERFYGPTREQLERVLEHAPPEITGAGA